jgi:hypothetical protein
MPDDNRQWILRRRPEGALTEDVFELVTSARPEPDAGQALVRVLALSLDPANRAWIAGPSYRPAVALDGPMDGFAVGPYARAGFPAFAAEWQRRHAYQGKPVKLLLPDGASVKGTVAGVDSTGALVLADGPRRARFLSGEISLRRA